MLNETELAAIRRRIDREAGDTLELSRAIWSHPETAFEEHFACRKQVEYLSAGGFEVESPFAGRATGYRATLGTGGPTFAFVAEYDALPKLGHGCGHNLIAAAAVAAGRAVGGMLREAGLPGRVMVLGTPGEESAGGKALMLRHGCLDGVDAAMMVHPSWRTTPDMGSLALRRFTVAFRGVAAHAATGPELGRNALDAVLLLFNAVNAWRQQLPESARIHGIVTGGGTASNIIPALASTFFTLRSPDEAYLDYMEKRFRRMVRGAALMTETRSLIKPSGPFYMSRRANPALNRAYVEAARHFGLAPETPTSPGRGSSDFGNFSHRIPAAHPYFAISCGRIAGHSTDFAAAANSEPGEQNMLKAAAALAAVGYRFLTSDSFRREVSG